MLSLLQAEERHGSAEERLQQMEQRLSEQESELKRVSVQSRQPGCVGRRK